MIRWALFAQNVERKRLVVWTTNRAFPASGRRYVHKMEHFSRRSKKPKGRRGAGTSHLCPVSFRAVTQIRLIVGFGQVEPEWGLPGPRMWPKVGLKAKSGVSLHSWAMLWCGNQATFAAQGWLHGLVAVSVPARVRGWGCEEAKGDIFLWCTQCEHRVLLPPPPSTFVFVCVG